MKKSMLATAFILLSAGISRAQENSGTIQYETTISFGDISLENVPPEIAAAIPKERKSKQVLYFTPSASLYETVKEEEKKSEYTSSAQNVHIKISTSSSEGGETTFADLDGKKMIEQKELMGKKFLISSTMEKMKWKMTGRQKMLLDYPVQEAMAIGDKDTVTAWFTPGIPVSTGPMGINGLPGIVLEASFGKMITVQATSVKTGSDVAAKIKAPDKGKQVSKEQFAKIVKEKEMEMQEDSGGGNGTRRTIIRTIGN